MAKQISPFHSADSKVYHIYGTCSSGKSVKKRKKGTSGRKLCKACTGIRAGKRTRGGSTDSTGPDYKSGTRRIR